MRDRCGPPAGGCSAVQDGAPTIQLLITEGMLWLEGMTHSGACWVELCNTGVCWRCTERGMK